MKEIMCDMDGVLAEFDALFDSYVQKAIPGIGRPNPNIFSFTQRYPAHRAEISKLFRKFVSDGWFLKARPIQGYEKVNQLDVTILTKRPKGAAEDTFLWLKRNGIRFKEVIMTSDKSKYIGRTAVILEDHPQYIMPFAKAGVRCYLFDRDFNRGVKHENIIRVGGWGDIDVKEIREYAINIM